MKPVKKWKDVKNSTCIPHYLAYEICSHKYSEMSQNNETVEITIGENDCEVKGDFSCKLKPATSYDLMIRICTDETFNDTEFVSFTTCAKNGIDNAKDESVLNISISILVSLIATAFTSLIIIFIASPESFKCGRSE